MILEAALSHSLVYGTNTKRCFVPNCDLVHSIRDPSIDTLLRCASGDLNPVRRYRLCRLHSG